MATSFTQTNTAANGSAIAAHCSGNSDNTGDTESNTAQVGGSAGSERTVTMDSDAADLNAVWMEVVNIDDYDGASGNWTWRINVTTANMQVTLDEVHICHVDSGYSAKNTLGSATGLGLALTSTGVQSATINQASGVTIAAGDKIIVIYAFDNGQSMAQAFGYTPDQIITGPGTIATGDVTLTADPGSLTFTGAVALFTTTLAAAGGSLVLSGADADFRSGVVADPGSLTLSGATAAFTTTLDAQPGSLVLSGADADFTIAAVLTADPGSLVLSGAEALFTTTLAADPASLALTGAEADFSIAAVLDAQPGSLVLSGATAGFTTTLDGQPGSLALTGADVTFTTVLDAQPNALALTGADASFVEIIVLDAQPGALVLTGAEATLSTTKIVAPTIPLFFKVSLASGFAALEGLLLTEEGGNLLFEDGSEILIRSGALIPIAHTALITDASFASVTFGGDIYTSVNL